MGQDFSMEDVNFPYIKQGQEYETNETIDEFIDELIKRVQEDSWVVPLGIVFYTRYRTQYGAPGVYKTREEDSVKKPEAEMDEFPMPATQEEIREFDRFLFTGKHRNPKKKQRSRSFSEASFRLLVLSRPKFVDKIITGYSTLTKKSPSKLKDYQQHLSLDQSKLCSDFPPDSTESSDVVENGSSTEPHSGHLKFCLKCGLPFLPEDVKSRSLDFEDLKVVCLTCLRESADNLVSEGLVLSENVDETVHTSTIETSEWSNKPSLNLINPLFTYLGVCSTEENGHDNFRTAHDHHDPNPHLVNPKQGTEVDVSIVPGHVTEFDASFAPGHVTECDSSTAAGYVSDSISQVVDSTADTTKSDPLIVPGHVRKQCQALLQSSQPYNTSPHLRKKLTRTRSDRTFPLDSSPLWQLHKGPVSPHVEQTNKWAKNYYSLARNSKFSEAVMAKGYVKALAEQINQQGSLKQTAHEDDEIENMESEMSKSTSSVVSCRNDENLVQENLVHSLIQAAEQQKFHEDETGRSPRKHSLSVNSEPDCSVLLHSHLVSDFLLRTGGDFSNSLSKKQSSQKDSVVCPASKTSKTSPNHTSFNPSKGTKSSAVSPESSTSSSQNISPTKCASSSDLPVKNVLSSCSQKPPVNYDQKPKIPAKPTLATVTTLNTCKNSSLPSSSKQKSALVSDASPTPKSSCVPKLPQTQSSITTSPTSPTAHSPKSPTSPQTFSPGKSSPAVRPSFKSASPIPSFIALSSKSSLSPKTPSAPSPITPSFKMQSPTNHSPKSPLSPPPKTCPTPPPKSPEVRTLPSLPPPTSLKGDVFKYEIQSSSTSTNQTETVQKWLSETESSLNLPASSNNEVCRRSVSKRSSDHYRDSVFQTIYDNPSVSAAELFDSSWSDSDGFNDGSDEDDEDEDNSKRKTKGPDANAVKDIKTEEISDRAEDHLESRRFHIAEELLQTERDYVARLHLLHHVFYFRLDNENRQQAFLPADALKHMFSNIKSIFLFHNDFVLPQLENRMQKWESEPRIGDLMKKNAPFLKMYTEYIRNFDRAMKLINQWMEKSSKFSEIIQDIQKFPECRNLSLQHHMLGPIQRVPRYELLLKDYVRHLPEDSLDMNDANDALDLVTKAACHSNEAMKKIETFHKLLDIYQSLRGVPVDFISPTREFVTQGPITKIAARSGEKQPRQIFLFNDLVLICTQYNLLGTYSVRSQLEVDGMEIKPGTSMHIPNTFLVHSKQKAVELLDENPTGEVAGWQERIQTVINNYKMRKRSIKPDEPRESEQEVGVPESCLGKTAPVWIQDDAATMCMVCRQTFNMVRRRHHCRACGKLICKACSKKAPLEYIQGKIERVCVKCYNMIVNKQNATDSDSTDGRTSPKKKGTLHVNASTGLISSYMQCSDDGGHKWQKLWVTAHKDFVLYTFRAHEDISAISSLPLPGHKVELCDIQSRQHVFCLSHKKKRIWMFQADNDKRLKRWISVLTKLAHAQLPDENSRLSSQSNSSNSSSVSDSGILHNGISSCNNKRNSTHSGSQADSGYPGDSNNSLAAFAGDDNDHDHTDDVSQHDNVDGEQN